MDDALRIGLLVDQFPELSETFIAAEARELVALGHAVHVEARAHAPNPNQAAAAGLDASYVEDDSAARRLADLIWLVARHPLGCARDLLERRRLGAEERLRLLRDFAPSARRLHAFGAQHLHAHFAAGAATDALRLGAVLGLPYSVMTHGYDIFQHPQNLPEKLRRASFALSPCDYSVRHLQEIAPEASARISRLITGVDVELFRRRTPHPERGIVLAVGRLAEKKGFGVLVRASVRLAGLERFERVVIAGAGPLGEELERLVAELGLGALVELAGPQSPEAIRELLERALVVAVPSVVASDGDRDTMPVIAKESLAMEVPVVASDAVGLPELVRLEWGRLVPPGDPEALAAALMELIELPAGRRGEMGRAGRAFVEESCNLRHETERLAGLIASAAPGRPDRRSG